MDRLVLLDKLEPLEMMEALDQQEHQDQRAQLVLTVSPDRLEQVVQLAHLAPLEVLV